LSQLSRNKLPASVYNVTKRGADNENGETREQKVNMDFLSSTSILQLSQSSSIDEVPAQSTTEPQSLENIERPSLSYKDLIIEAIESSPDKRLKLNEIYQPMAKFAPLSLLALYKEHLCSAHIGNTGTGHFWTVVPELSDKQTLRRRNRSTNRGGNRLKTTESLQDTTVMREELTSSGSGGHITKSTTTIDKSFVGSTETNRKSSKLTPAAVSGVGPGRSFLSNAGPKSTPSSKSNLESIAGLDCHFVNFNSDANKIHFTGQTRNTIFSVNVTKIMYYVLGMRTFKRHEFDRLN
ncbi:fork head domain protein, partial [Ostertagia ostertagi]